MTSLFCHCEERDSSVTPRNRLRNLKELMGLPRPDKSGLAMTKKGGQDDKVVKVRHTIVP
jgi:hypothetical protein